MLDKTIPLMFLATCLTSNVACDGTDDAEPLDSAAEDPDESDEEATFRASCSGTGCNGRPVSTECKSNYTKINDTRTIYHTSNGVKKAVGYIEIYWSYTCSTNWARVVRTDGWPDGMYATIQRPGGMPYTNFALSGSATSPMVYAPSPACAFAKGTIDFSYTSASAETSCW